MRRRERGLGWELRAVLQLGPNWVWWREVPSPALYRLSRVPLYSHSWAGKQALIGSSAPDLRSVALQLLPPTPLLAPSAAHCAR